MKFFLSLLFVGFVSVPLQLHAQNELKVWDIHTEDARLFFDNNKKEIGLSSHDEMKVKYMHTDRIEMTHTRFTQSYKGLEVLGSSYILHAQNGQPFKGNGNLLTGLHLDTTATISPQQASNIAKNLLAGKMAPPIDLGYTANFPTVCEKAITSSDFPIFTDAAALVYVVQVMSPSKSIQHEYWIDAHSGNPIHSFSMIEHTAVQANGKSLYYGDVDFICDSIGPNEFLLQDLTKGKGVITTDVERGVFKSSSLPWDLSGQGMTEAIDLHWCSSEFYDYMLEEHQWDGLDGNGAALIASLATHYVNASWNGQYASFGRGDCNHGPLTTLEVVGHEFAHGITDFTSDLVYSNEPGALNEHISDVFGKALEYHVDPQNFNWKIGESFEIHDYSSQFRDLANPHSKDHPKYYGGLHWDLSKGVHASSTVASHWFYLLVEGGQGQNEMGESYNISGIGMQKAVEIVFATQRDYLFPTATYLDYCLYTIEVAKNRFQMGSPEYRAVVDAWKAVGLPGGLARPESDLGIILTVANSATCIDSAVIPFSYEIINYGTEPFVPSRPISITFESQIINQFNQRLEPGESVVFYDSTHFISSEYEWDWLWLTFDQRNFKDDNLANNRSTHYYTNGNNQDGDLSISRLNGLSMPCDANHLNVRFSVTNVSCSSSPQGRILTAKAILQSTGEEMQFDYTLPKIDFLSTTNLEAELPISWAGQDVRVILHSQADTNEDNDDMMVNYNASEFKKNGFTDLFDLFDEARYTLDDWRAGAHGVLPYQGENVLWWTGRTLNPTRLPCFEVEDNLDQNYSGSLSFCADMTGVVDPSLSFDIAFLQDDRYDLSSDFDQITSAVRLELMDDSGVASSIISDTSEGRWESLEFKLPNDFAGEIKFSFYAYSGHYGLEVDSLISRDVILMDNLKLKGKSTSVSPEEDRLSSIVISPNPTQEKVFLKNVSIESVKSVAILNVQGKVCLETNRIPQDHSIDLNSIQAGVYWVRVISIEGNSITIPFVKL